jgi:hypothetical protein
VQLHLVKPVRGLHALVGSPRCEILTTGAGNEADSLPARHSSRQTRKMSCQMHRCSDLETPSASSRNNVHLRRLSRKSCHLCRFSLSVRDRTPHIPTSTKSVQPHQRQSPLVSSESPAGGSSTYAPDSLSESYEAGITSPKSIITPTNSSYDIPLHLHCRQLP